MDQYPATDAYLRLSLVQIQKNDNNVVFSAGNARGNGNYLLDKLVNFPIYCCWAMYCQRNIQPETKGGLALICMLDSLTRGQCEYLTGDGCMIITSSANGTPRLQYFCSTGEVVWVILVILVPDI